MPPSPAPSAELCGALSRWKEKPLGSAVAAVSPGGELAQRRRLQLSSATAGLRLFCISFPLGVLNMFYKQ